jgi:hypothetical protein
MAEFTILQPRTCGTCTLCCKLIEVTELEKPRGTWCHHCRQHQGQGGCNIYQDRPLGCREFVCGWLQGEVPEDLKPESCGAVFDMDNDGKTIVMHFNTTKTPSRKLLAYIDRLVATGNGILVIEGDRVNFRGSKEKLIKFLDSHPGTTV